MMETKKLNAEQLSDEELHKVAGGSIGEYCTDKNYRLICKMARMNGTVDKLDEHTKKCCYFIVQS